MKHFKFVLTLPHGVGAALAEPRVAGWRLVRGVVIRGGSEVVCMLVRQEDREPHRAPPRA